MLASPLVASSIRATVFQSLAKFPAPNCLGKVLDLCSQISCRCLHGVPSGSLFHNPNITFDRHNRPSNMHSWLSPSKNVQIGNLSELIVGNRSRCYISRTQVASNERAVLMRPMPVWDCTRN